jgi:hypothetical protein
MTAVAGSLFACKIAVLRAKGVNIVHPVAADLQFDERQYVRGRDIKSAVSPRG